MKVRIRNSLVIILLSTLILQGSYASASADETIQPALGTMLAAASSSQTSADVQPINKVRFKQYVHVNAVGDISVTNEVIYALSRYDYLKRNSVSTATMLRNLQMSASWGELLNAHVESDDALRAMRYIFVARGAFRNQGKQWWGEVLGAGQAEVIAQTDNSLTLLQTSMENGVENVGTVYVYFPIGTKNITFDAVRGGILCSLPQPTAVPDGEAAPVMNVSAIEELMSCMSKVYGNQRIKGAWVAKAVLSNDGTAPVSDYRVRFSIQDYTSWSPWMRTPFVYPGQTVVETYHPQIAREKIRDLQSETPVTMLLEWSYRLPSGETIEDSDSRQMTLLGMNEVFYSSLPMAECTSWSDNFNMDNYIIPCFVSHTDPVIQRFAGLAAKASDGAAASSPEGAIKYMEGIWAVMTANSIKYILPPEGKEFTDRVRQHIRHGRDVLQNRAGTCIDLACLFASTCEAGGLQACIMMVPGHAFPVIKMPGGGYWPLETTMVSDKVAFDKASEYARKEFQDAINQGDYHLVDVSKMRSIGVPAPEMPILTGDPLRDWGISFDIDTRATDNPIISNADSATSSANTGNTITDPRGVFTVVYPLGWMVTQKGFALTGVEPQSGASFGCESAPKQFQTVAQFAQTMCANMKSNTPEWSQNSMENIVRDGLPGVHVVATGKPGGIQMIGNYWFLLTPTDQVLVSAVVRNDRFNEVHMTLDRIYRSIQIAK